MLCSQVEILLAVNAGEGWAEALRRTIPQRKQLQRFGSSTVPSKHQAPAPAGKQLYEFDSGAGALSEQEDPAAAFTGSETQ